MLTVVVNVIISLHEFYQTILLQKIHSDPLMLSSDSHAVSAPTNSVLELPISGFIYWI